MIYVLIALGALLFILLSVIIIRTLAFVPKDTESTLISAEEVNIDKALSDLAEMIRCKTVSDVDRKNEDENEFIKFKKLLPKLFPNIFAKCEYEEVTDRGLLFRYRGKSSDSPLVLMAHFDVVSVEEDQWEKPPFYAVYEDEVLWGRGTLDTKGTLNGAMQALEQLILSGFTPENDIYLAFAGDEEVNGYGASSIVDLFEKRNITPAAVIDEGGAVVKKVFPGVSKPCAVIGIAEKGMLNAEFSFSGNGGHASSPKPHTPVGKLSQACVNVESKPFKYRVCEATALMLDTLARHSSFVYRMIFSNLWLFGPVLNMIGKKNGGELNAIVRTTCAFTQMEGSKGMNVIPPHARMVANLRILPGETTESALEYLKKTVNNDEVAVKKISGMDPSRISTIKTAGWEKLVNAVSSTWPEAIVSPYLMVACSDSRHWGRISDKVYRFSAMALSSEERASIHGNNERIKKETVKKTVEFYLRLIKQF